MRRSRSTQATLRAKSSRQMLHDELAQFLRCLEREASQPLGFEAKTVSIIDGN